MWRTLALASVSTIALASASAAPADAAVKAKLEPVASGLTAPLAMVQPNGDDRRFIIEQDGRVKILTKDGKLLPEPFLDIRHKLKPQWSDFDEKGLLGIAFHPKFKENGRFYIAYSAPISFEADLAKQFWWSHTNIVAEYRVSADDPNKADPNYERIVTAIDWPQFNHNGHWIGFGPDGMLYISTGDGGYANDWGIGHNVTEGNGQDLMSLHGKILRIDVDGGHPYAIPADNPFVGRMDALPEIWAYGLRNPWRCSFDMGGDHRLFCGDVQQNSYEEVDIIVKGGNYGWRKMEATHCFDYVKPNDHPANCDKNGLILPILEYKNCTAKPDGCMGISVTGGYVYRGSHKPWQGKYIFGDWSKTFATRNGQLFMATEGADGKWTMEPIQVVNMDGPLPYVLAFAQDASGEVYVLTSLTTGPVGGLDTIYRIAPAE
ncbi:Quinoprotein glucose dehydrogenase B [bacterium HR40]|nr:Quinoprotein glucose dehydrogenase B [bacterium HR40]